MKKISFKLMALVFGLFLINQTKAQVTIFSENWSSNTFTANNWTFPLGQPNWTVGAAYTPAGGTSPNAYFSYNPTLSNYTVSMLSNTISAVTYTAGPILLDYLLQLNNFSTSTLEQFIVEYKPLAALNWSTVAVYSNTLSGISNWAVSNYTLTGVQGQVFQLRFTAFGANSFNINGWGVDNITVKTPCIPSLAASATPSAICAGGTRTLTASGSTNYTWTPGGSTLTSVAVNPTVSTTYSVASTNTTLGCVEVRTLQVGVTPTLNITGPATVCVQKSATLTANGASSYTWSTGSTSSVIVSSPSSTTVYTLTGNSGGCISTAQYTLNASPVPVVAVTPSTPCTPGNHTLSASGSNTYTWSPGSFTTTSIVVNPTVSTTYTLLGTNTVVGCTQTVTTLVALIPTITIAGPSTVCVGNAVTLTANGASTYTWNTGSTAVSISPSPSATTVYTVTGSTGGCSSSSQFTLSTIASPTVTISSTSTNYCYPAGSALSFTANGASTYTWSPGANLSPSTGAVVTATNLTGPTNIFVTGTSSLGCSATSSAVTISYVPGVSITSLTSSSPTLCAGNSTTLSVTAADATLAPYCQPVYSTGTSVGDYIGGVTLGNITNTTTGAASPYYTLYPPTITTTLTAGAAYTLTLQPGTYSSSNGLASWIDYNHNGNLFDPNEKIAQLTINAAYPATGLATFTVPLTATNGTTTLRVREVFANSNIDPCASATYGETEDYVVTIVGGVTPANTYTWAPSSFLSSTSTASTVANTVTASTVYTVNVNNSFGCATQGTIGLNVTPSPTITAATSATNFICIGQSATLTANGGASYVWNTTATTAVIAVSPTTSTSYTVTGTNASGCSASAVVSQSVSNCTGITNYATTPVLNVYPNPGTGIYNLEIENTSKIEVCDLFGKIILSTTVEAGKFSLNISEQAKGIYILKATGNGNIQTVRLVKE